MQGTSTSVTPPKGAFSIQDIQDTNLSPEEKLNRTRELYRETAAIRRAFMPAEKMDIERKRGREYMALKRAFMTPEERENHNKRNRERVRLKRMYMTEEKKDAIRKMQRERLQRKRAEMTEEEKLQKREKWRVQMQQKRAAFTEEEKGKLRAYNREKARQYRQRKQYLQQDMQEQGASFTGVWPPYDMYHPGLGPPSQVPVGLPNSNCDQQDVIEEAEPPTLPTPLNMESSKTDSEQDNEDGRKIDETAVNLVKQEPATESTPPSSDHPSPTPNGSGDNAAATPESAAGTTSSSLPPSIQKPFQIVYRAVNKLRKFCHEQYQTEEFERFDQATLSDLLGAFYASVEQLPWMGLQMTEFVIVMREGLVCYMRDFLQVDIENDPGFEGANREFCQRLEALMEKAAATANQTKGDGAAPVGTAEGPSRASPYAPPELRVDEEATQRVVDFFRGYLTAQGKSEEFESFPKEALNEALHGFYIYAKKLPQRSLPDPYRILRLRLAHHMKVATNIDIVHDPAFESANSICKVPSGKINHLEMPLNAAVPAPNRGEISREDMVTILSSERMDPGNPQGLLNLSMFNVVFYLCRSIRHGLADLMRLMDKGTFLFEKNERNVEHVAWQSNYVETMPEVVGHPLCPVAIFKVYLSKLSPHTNTLWQHPLKKPCGSDVWYHANIPIGSRKIQLFFDRLCRDIGLKTPYTLLALQSTPLQTMSDALRRVRSRGSKISLTGPALPSSGNQRRGRKRVATAPTAGAATSAIRSLDELEGCLNTVDWSSTLPEWTDLIKYSHCTRNIDFLKQLLEVYQHSLDSGAIVRPPGTIDPVVGVIPSSSSSVAQSAERQERARRLDAFLASTTKSSSSRRKSSVVQRRGRVASRTVDPRGGTEGVDSPGRTGDAVEEMAVGIGDGLVGTTITNNVDAAHGVEVEVEKGTKATEERSQLDPKDPESAAVDLRLGTERKAGIPVVDAKHERWYEF